MGRAEVVINEFLAANTESLQDARGNYSDWIEILNTGTTPESLTGWSLTDKEDKPAKWLFPALILAPGAYCVVFASGDDTTDGEALHTSFRLSHKGEFLGLYDSSGALRDSIGPAFPEQIVNVSYGRRTGQPGWWYLEPPTPGAANSGSQAYAGITAPPSADQPRGFYDNPVEVTLTAASPGARIWYTRNGKVPVPHASEEYTAPLNIAVPTVLRAAAQQDGFRASEALTQTYLIGISEAVKSLPSISLAGDPESSLYEPDGVMAIVGGIYAGYPDPSWAPRENEPGDYNNPIQRGEDYERPISAEFLDPTDNAGVQADCGIRVHGSDYHRARYRRGDDWFACLPPDTYNKFSFKLYFRDAYGPETLEAPIFPEPSLNTSTSVVLRGGHSDICAPFVTDELFRRLHLDMGYPEAVGTFSTLFINGEYKGLYNPTERVDEDYLRDVYGRNSDWDVMTRRGALTGLPRDGSTDAWDTLMDRATNNFLGDPAAYESVVELLDITSFVDFLILELYAGNTDWPGNNWIAARERRDGAKFTFFVWDTELGMTPASLDWNGFYKPGGGLFYQQRPIAQLFQSLYHNANFRQLFADRVQEHFFGQGALVDAHVAARYQELRNQILDFFPETDTYITNVFIPQRREIVLAQFAQEGLYPMEAPRLLVNGTAYDGSLLTSGTALELERSTGQGTIYYTTDGTDPRQPSGWQAEFTTLAAESAPKKVLVPSALTDALLYPAGFETAYIKSTGIVDHYTRAGAQDRTAAQTVFTDASLWAATGFGTPATINYLNTGPGGHFGGDEAFPSTLPGVNQDDFAMFASGDVFVPVAGYWTFGVRSDDGFRLDIGENTMYFDGARDQAEDALSLFIFDEPGTYSVFLGYFEHSGDAEIELFAAPGYHTEFDPELFHLVGDGLGGDLRLTMVKPWNIQSFPDNTWAQGTGAAGFRAGGEWGVPIGSDVSAMRVEGGASSCLLRIPFNLTDEQRLSFNLLALRMRFSDGFAAYLNGTLVASANAPEFPQWNSGATAERTPEQAVQWKKYDITRWLVKLKTGANVLAIQGLASGVGDDDFLISSELLAGHEETIPGGIAASAQTAQAPLIINDSVRLMTRTWQDGVWGALSDTALTVGTLSDCVVITELMYHPSEDLPEFVELLNTCDYAVNLSGAYFSAGIDFQFPPNTFLPAGERLLLSNTASLFGQRYPGVRLDGVFDGALNNSGETITLVDGAGNTVFTFTYSDSGLWPEDPDGEGASLVAVDGTGDPNDPAYWRASLTPGGSPGREDAVAASPILVNEALAWPEAEGDQKIEMYNPAASSTDVRGWYLTNDKKFPWKARIPDAPQFILPPGGFAVISAAAFADAPGMLGNAALPGFTLDAYGEGGVYLFSANTAGNLTGYKHGFGLDVADRGVSLGRFTTSTGEDHFVAQTSQTFGAANANPRVGPVVISEIHFLPLPAEVEYLELTNSAAAPVNLYDTEHPEAKCQVEGIGFQFPEGVVLPVGGKVLVVNADPVLFQETYSIPQNVPVFGPFGNSSGDGVGALSDTGETLRVLMPLTMPDNLPAFASIDKVKYGVGPPWPSVLDDNLALRRIYPGRYGNDSVNWQASPPTYVPAEIEEGEDEGEDEGEEDGEEEGEEEGEEIPDPCCGGISRSGGAGGGMPPAESLLLLGVACLLGKTMLSRRPERPAVSA
jgi:hypothetical protein